MLLHSERRYLILPYHHRTSNRFPLLSPAINPNLTFQLPPTRARQLRCCLCPPNSVSIDLPHPVCARKRIAPESSRGTKHNLDRQVPLSIHLPFQEKSIKPSFPTPPWLPTASSSSTPLSPSQLPHLEVRVISARHHKPSMTRTSSAVVVPSPRPAVGNALRLPNPILPVDQPWSRPLL